MPYICSRTKITFHLRFFIEIAYKGTNYHGWQIQPNVISVQEHINKAFSVILKSKIEVVGAGRTDAGVHAEQLYAHFDFNEVLDPNLIKYKANSLLPNEIVIKNIFEVNADSHARFDASKRSYEYRIFLGRNPFEIETTWQLNNKKLNVDKMNEAAKILLTFSNFKCFSRTNTGVKTYDCKIIHANWELENKKLIFHISADRFLRNMVRAIVGTLLSVGMGKTSIEEFKNIIKSKDRSNAGTSAPAQGLFLTEVIYPKHIYLNE